MTSKEGTTNKPREKERLSNPLEPMKPGNETPWKHKIYIAFDSGVGSFNSGL
jgi:hypothetical protein